MSNNKETYAAIDLGSNSFHMVVANYVDGRALIVDRIKEMVRLAGGLDDDRHLTEEAIQVAIQCLEKFAQRTSTIPASNVRAVGTNTLRQARNGLDFLNRANTALGHKIEIISGREEARLVYLGVANTIFNDKDKRLIVDIGGGSTELIIGQGFDAVVTESLFMGCVSLSQQFFKDGEITPKRMRKARIAALQELENIQDHYLDYGWDSVVGTSGTIRAILEVSVEKGWSDSTITTDALSSLRKTILDFGNIDKINFSTLSPNRKPVFVGGVIVLSAVFEALGIQSMEYSDGALREGLLYDLIGRQHDQDVRDKTVDRLSNRYSIDIEHANQVETIVKKIFKSVKDSWNLNKKDDFKMIKWAARLHEVGLAISHSQYHKHGAYLLSNSDLPGFSRQEQNTLSTLVRAHRRKFPLGIFDLISDEEIRTKMTQLTIILRLAIVLSRSRNTVKLPDINVDSNSIKIEFDDGWLADNPLTEADLETESNYISVTGYKLKYKVSEQD